MVAQNVFFGIIAFVMICSAFKVVTTKNVIHAALWLVVVLAGVAGQFLLLGAEFVGVTQILVYIGAVVVLLLFGVMLFHFTGVPVTGRGGGRSRTLTGGTRPDTL